MMILRIFHIACMARSALLRSGSPSCTSAQEADAGPASRLPGGSVSPGPKFFQERPNSAIGLFPFVSARVGAHRPGLGGSSSTNLRCCLMILLNSRLAWIVSNPQ